MRAELQSALASLPSSWPLIWVPSPAELGLLPAGQVPRPVFELPKGSGTKELFALLRYAMVARPLKGSLAAVG